VMPAVHNGMMLIKPSSIAFTGSGSSAVINSTGSVSFEICESLSLNEVFSLDYDNYVIDLRCIVNINQEPSFRLRSSAGDNATTNSYVTERYFVSSTTFSASRFTSTLAILAASAQNTRDGHKIFVYGPALSEPTAGRVTSVAGGSSVFASDHVWTHNQALPYHGFTVFRGASQNLSGLIKVYGLRQ